MHFFTFSSSLSRRPGGHANPRWSKKPAGRASSRALPACRTGWAEPSSTPVLRAAPLEHHRKPRVYPRRRLPADEPHGNRRDLPASSLFDLFDFPLFPGTQLPGNPAGGGGRDTAFLEGWFPKGWRQTRSSRADAWPLYPARRVAVKAQSRRGASRNPRRFLTCRNGGETYNSASFEDRWRRAAKPTQRSGLEEPKLFGPVGDAGA